MTNSYALKNYVYNYKYILLISSKVDFVIFLQILTTIVIDIYTNTWHIFLTHGY